MVPCFLRSEISKLNHKDLYLDGTFSLVRDLDYSQIYIVSIVFRPVITSEEDLNMTEFANLSCDSDSEIDSDSEF